MGVNALSNDVLQKIHRLNARVRLVVLTGGGGGCAGWLVGGWVVLVVLVMAVCFLPQLEKPSGGGVVVVAQFCNCPLCHEVGRKLKGLCFG